jgi:hypothetical protein
VIRASLVVLCLLFSSAVVASPASRLEARPITQAKTVLAVYTEDWGLFSAGGPKLIFAAWPDVHVVWSADPIKGGAPYLAAEVPPAQVAELVTRLKQDGIFSDSRLRRSYYGPDSEFTTILLRSEKKRVEMRSWHELLEASGQAAGFNGEKDFLHFRKVWDQTRTAFASLASGGGRQIKGELLMRHGIVSWREQ